MKSIIPLVSQKDLPEEGCVRIIRDEKSYLVICHQGKTHVIANHCGHFGIPLEDGKIENGAIYCSQHGIGFDLSSGAIINRPYENCDPIQVFDVEYQEGNVCIRAEG